MNRDAFTGGVEPGGLWNQNDIRILICYLVRSVNTPLAQEDISDILQDKALANYFEVGDAVSALLRHGNLNRREDGLYELTESGREIADNLDVSLPLSVRDKALEAAFLLLARARAERENHVELKRTENGLQVVCRISGGASDGGHGGEMDLMKIALYVPDEGQARMVKENFYKDPQGLYQLVLAALTGDKKLIRSYLEERE